MHMNMTMMETFTNSKVRVTMTIIVKKIKRAIMRNGLTLTKKLSWLLVKLVCKALMSR